MLHRSGATLLIFTLLFPVAVLLLAPAAIGAAPATLAQGAMTPGEPPVWPAPSPAQSAPSTHRQQQAQTPASWVDTTSREAVQTAYLVDYQGSQITNSGWTGNHANCDVGATSVEFRAAVLRRINYFRTMAGIPPLTDLAASYNEAAQAAALMMSANRKLSHSPTSDWTCYTERGRMGAGSSDLYLGVFGPDAISGYIVDPGSGNTSVGHRRWILLPQTRFMGTGDIPPAGGYPPANALWVFDNENMGGPRPTTRDDFVAWPPPGFVPYPIIYPRWSFSYPGADFSEATVTMTRAGQPLGVQVNPATVGYGENTLVWEPQASFGSLPATDTAYAVTLGNVVIAGQPRSFTYTVVAIDTNMAPLFTSTPITTAVQDIPYVASVSVYDPGVAYGEILTVTATTLPAWLTLTDHQNGTATLSGAPKDAEVGEHPVVLNVVDNSGLSATQSFTLAVANVNDAPVFASSPVSTVIEGAFYSYNIIARDQDLRLGDSLTITASLLPAWLSLDVRNDGAATLSGVATLAEMGEHAVSLRVVDGGGLAAEQVFTVAVLRGFYLPLMLNNAR